MMAKMGRPIKYNEEYCERVLKIARNDNECISKTYLAVELGICKDSLYRWAKEYPDFSVALKMAMGYIENRWQKLGFRMATGAQQGNATAYIWLTKNVLGYADKVETTNKVSIDGIDFSEDED
jgi:hypothetical protein